MDRKVELLSPAGSYDAFIGAINAGADAVYLSGKDFGARAYAQNFENDILPEIIDTAHLFNKKVYLTINTLVKQNEIDKVCGFLEEPVCHHLDAVIVQDMGVLSRIHNCFSNLPLHCSTQMSCTMGLSSDILKKYNVTRIIPARELSFEEIAAMKKRTGLEIECFIHGAMCYSYSGMCLFSSILGGRSGNRGRCAQPCRLPYSSQNMRDNYLLSMNDMCTLGILEDLIDSGIDSFKIEGRMKKSVYSAGVTSVYRKYIDRIYKGDFDGIDRDDYDLIKNLYLRTSISEGYYRRQNGPDMITIDSPSYNGSDDGLLSDLEEKYIHKKPKLEIELFASIKKDRDIVLTAKFRDIDVKVISQRPETAQNAPISVHDVEKHLSKTGDTFFHVRNIKLELDDGLFINVARINAMRRELLTALYNEIIKCNINSM